MYNKAKFKISFVCPSLTYTLSSLDDLKHMKYEHYEILEEVERVWHKTLHATLID